VPVLAGAGAVGTFLLVGLAREEISGTWFPINIAGILVWPWEDHDRVKVLVLASVVAVAAGFIVVLCGVRFRGIAVILLGVAFVLSSIQAEFQVVQPWNERIAFVSPTVAAVRNIEATLGHQVPVVFYGPRSVYTTQNLDQYWMVPRVLPVVSGTSDLTGEELVIAPTEWPEAASLGARRVSAWSGPPEILWVLPGDLQSELDAHGLLESTPEPAQG
jgi:hypothetical protein